MATYGTVSDFINPDDFIGGTVEELTYLTQDNDSIVFEVTLSNGHTFEGQVNVNTLVSSEAIDLPDETYIDGNPVEETFPEDDDGE